MTHSMPRYLCRDCCRIVDGRAEACGRCSGARLLAHPEIDTLGIAHIDCDAFYAAVEKRDRPELRDAPWWSAPATSPAPSGFARPCRCSKPWHCAHTAR